MGAKRGCKNGAKSPLEDLWSHLGRPRSRKRGCKICPKNGLEKRRLLASSAGEAWRNVRRSWALFLADLSKILQEISHARPLRPFWLKVQALASPIPEGTLQVSAARGKRGRYALVSGEHGGATVAKPWQTALIAAQRGRGDNVLHHLHRKRVQAEAPTRATAAQQRSIDSDRDVAAEEAAAEGGASTIQ